LCGRQLQLDGIFEICDGRNSRYCALRTLFSFAVKMGISAKKCTIAWAGLFDERLPAWQYFGISSTPIDIADFVGIRFLAARIGCCHKRKVPTLRLLNCRESARLYMQRQQTTGSGLDRLDHISAAGNGAWQYLSSPVVTSHLGRQLSSQDIISRLLYRRH
jgi:hypothetical protein